jgi:hypothetical protein
VPMRTGISAINNSSTRVMLLCIGTSRLRFCLFERVAPDRR